MGDMNNICWERMLNLNIKHDDLRCDVKSVRKKGKLQRLRKFSMRVFRAKYVR